LWFQVKQSLTWNELFLARYTRQVPWYFTQFGTDGHTEAEWNVFATQLWQERQEGKLQTGTYVPFHSLLLFWGIPNCNVCKVGYPTANPPTEPFTSTTYKEVDSEDDNSDFVVDNDTTWELD
jgi:hypothetical protein